MRQNDRKGAADDLRADVRPDTIALMSKRLESILIALACLFVVFSFAAYLAFLAHTTGLAATDGANQVYSGWAGGVAQAIATVFGGALAIGGGYLAYVGTIRAAKINLEAAAKGVEAAQAKELSEISFQAKTLAISVIGEVTESLFSIQVDSLANAVRTGTLESLEITVIQRPRFLDMDVRQVAVMGLDVVKARQKFAEQLDLTIKCADAALALIHRSADEAQRIVHASEMVQIATEARELAYELLVELHRLAGVDLRRQAKASPESPRPSASG